MTKNPLQKNAKPRYLTKSRFKVAIECPTKLYYTGKKNEYTNLMAENEFLQALAEGGFQVGELAKCYFPGGTDIETLDYEASLKQTNDLLNQENCIIYEAAIQFENFFIRVDILNKQGNEIQLIEVKAKSIHPEKNDFMTKKTGIIIAAWRPYLYDVAFQTWVMTHAFPNWNVLPFLMLADKSKDASVDGLNQLFRIKRNSDHRIKIITTVETMTPDLLGDQILIQIPVKKFVDQIIEGQDADPKNKKVQQLEDFSKSVREYARYYEQNERYPITIGAKCKGCEFKNTSKTKECGTKSGYEECWTEFNNGDFDASKPHIFDIWSYRGTEKLIDSGHIYMEDPEVKKSFFKKDKNGQINFKGVQSERQLLQVTKTCLEPDGKEDIKPTLFEKLATWKFPLHFIDFETSMVAIPFNANRRPYEQIAFQFSSHTLYKDGKIDHHEWIHKNPGEFPNFEFAKALKSVLEKDEGTILRYAAHENSIMREIYNQMEEESRPEYQNIMEWIDTITTKNSESIGAGKDDKITGERSMVDMCDLVRRYYYHPGMKGSNSIKAVLPAILSCSKILKEKYSIPLSFGTHLNKKIMWQFDTDAKKVKDPYTLLGPILDKDNSNPIDLLFETSEIKEGSAAMLAYAKMQFTEMSEKERTAILSALLRYCELDTLAMLMIYEHWMSMESVHL